MFKVKNINMHATYTPKAQIFRSTFGSDRIKTIGGVAVFEEIEYLLYKFREDTQTSIIFYCLVESGIARCYD